MVLPYIMSHQNWNISNINVKCINNFDDDDDNNNKSGLSKWLFCGKAKK